MPRHDNIDDLEVAKAIMSNRIYEAVIFLEKFEHAGKIAGNAHHLAQEICEFAEQLLEKRWQSEGWCKMMYNSAVEVRC